MTDRASTDYSVEPKVNDNSFTDGANKGFTVRPVSEVGAASQRTAITVTDTVQTLSIGVNKTTIKIFNQGSKIIYYGGIDVTSNNGISIFPGNSEVFARVKSDFAIGLICASSETSELRIVEFA